MRKSVHTAEYTALRAALKAARSAADLSQRDLAAALKVPHSVVAKIESGERRLDVVEFCWFATACGADPVAILATLRRDSSRAARASVGRGGRKP
jgi:transcriptional regulator with XRE-family HTH domain